MKSKMLFIICFLLLSFTFYPMTFAEYAQLVGKRVEIHGPSCWDTLGVALDKTTCDELRETLNPENKGIFETLLTSYKILRITKNTKALVLDAEIIEGKAHVVILTGIYKGMSGWIPIEWLDGNEKRPTLIDSDKYPIQRHNVDWLNEV